MKTFLIFLFITVNLIYCDPFSNIKFYNVCDWQAKREEIIKQLTPNGQKYAVKILENIQFIAGAGKI